MSKGSQPQVMAQNVPKYDANQQQLMSYLTNGTLNKTNSGSNNTIQATGQNYMSANYNPTGPYAAANAAYSAQPAPVKRQNTWDVGAAIAAGMNPRDAYNVGAAQQPGIESEYQNAMASYKAGKPIQPTPQEQKYFDYLNNPTYFNDYVMNQIPKLDMAGSTQRINDQFNPTAQAQEYSNSMMPIAMRNWETYGKPQTQAAYAGPGYYGTARGEALRKSLTDVNDNVNKGMIDSVYTPTLNARGTAMNNLFSADYAQTSKLGDISAGLNSTMPQQWKSAADMARSYQTMEADPNIAQIYKILGLDPFNTVGGVVAGQPNTWGNVLGSVLGMAAGKV